MLSIADNGLGFAMDTTGKSVGSRLIKTFGLQLGGRLDCPLRAGQGHGGGAGVSGPGLERDKPLI